jgi:hypothetical protein
MTEGNWSSEQGRRYLPHEMANFVYDICQDEIHEAIAYWVSEVNYYKDKVEELELELMLRENEFSETAMALNPKRRSNFR